MTALEQITDFCLWKYDHTLFLALEFLFKYKLKNMVSPKLFGLAALVTGFLIAAYYTLWVISAIVSLTFNRNTLQPFMKGVLPCCLFPPFVCLF